MTKFKPGFDASRDALWRKRAIRRAEHQVLKQIVLGIVLALVVAMALIYSASAANAHGIIICSHIGCSDRAPPRAIHQRGHRHVAAHHHRKAPAPRLDANGNSSRLIKVSTAAGITITVAPSFAPKIQGFIADLVARGYKPRHIGCYSWAASHVANSLHHSGQACDFDQRGWGRTAPAMYHVADLVAKWGLRDGGEFADWGHIDTGPHLRRGRRAAHRLAHPPFYGATADYRQHQVGG